MQQIGSQQNDKATSNSTFVQQYESLSYFDFHTQLKVGLIAYSSFFVLRIIMVYWRSSRSFLPRKNIWVSLFYAYLAGGLISLMLMYFFQSVLELFTEPLNLDSAKEIIEKYYNITMPNITQEDPNLQNYFKQKSDQGRYTHFYQNKLFIANIMVAAGFLTFIFFEKLQSVCIQEALKYGKNITPKKKQQHDGKYIETNTADPSMNINQVDEENNNNINHNHINCNNNNQEQVDEPDDPDGGDGDQRDEIRQQQNFNSDPENNENDPQILQIKQMSMNIKKMDLEERISQEIEQRTKRSTSPLKQQTTNQSSQVNDKKTIDLPQQFQIQLEKKRSIGLDPFNPQQQEIGSSIENSPTSAVQVVLQQQNTNQDKQQQAENQEDYEDEEEDEYSFQWKKNCIDTWKNKDHRIYIYTVCDLILNLYDGLLMGISLSCLQSKYAIMSLLIIFIKKFPEELEQSGILERYSLQSINSLCCRLIATIFGFLTMFSGLYISNNKYIPPFILGNFIALLGASYPNIFKGKTFIPCIIHSLFFILGSIIFYLM